MSWDLTIEHIGGIRDGTAQLDEGVNAVRASNWHGKSSFIDAVKAVYGIAVPPTNGVNSGSVFYSMEGSGSGEVTVVREEDGYHVEGDPLLEADFDRERVRLFAALDEANPVRRAVRNGADLESILTRPLDFADIDQQIAEHKREREAVTREIADARQAAEELTDARQRVSELESTLAELRDRRASVTPPDSGPDRSETRDELSDLRAERERLEERRERLENTIETVESTLADRRQELAAIDVPDVESVVAELEAIESEFRSLERDADLLSEVHSANRRLLSEDRSHLLDGVEHGLEDDSVTCWLCGTTVHREAVDSHLDTLRERAAEIRDKAATKESQLEELRSRRDEAREAGRRKSDVQSEIRDLEERLADRRSTLESTSEDLARIEGEIESLSATVEEADEAVTDLESELKYTRAALEDASERAEDLEASADRLDTLRTEKERIDGEIEDLRERKDRIKRETRASFQRALEAILARFDTGFEGAHLTQSFELVVARDGREAPLETLSQGEQELLGIITALAGHEAYEVTSVASVLLFDDLGGLMDENVGTLIEYVRDRADYVLFTSYPSQAAFSGHEVETADWTLVSRDPPVT